MKPYKIEITTNHACDTWEAVGHFIKEPYFVIEGIDGERIMINNDIIEMVFVHEEWQDDD